MRALLGISAVLLIAVAGCGREVLHSPAPGEHVSEQWMRVVATLPDRVEPTSRNPCGRGSPACIDTVMAEMQRRLDVLAAECDHNAPFALMYLRVTEGAGKNTARRFSDRAYLNHLDATFAELYFDAFDAWRAGDEESVPEAWQTTFNAADDRVVNGLGDMLLGMNAHISRDLPFALERAGLVDSTGASARADFDAVNALLIDVQEPIIEEESARFDRGIGDATLPALEVDAESIGELISQWRSEAWANAKRLITTEGAEREAIISGIEEAAAGRARLIEALTSNLVIGPDATERASYCEARDGGV